MNKQELYAVPIPPATDSYSPVSHQNIIENVYEQLDKRGLSVNDEHYNVGRKGQQLIGYVTVGANDTEMEMKLAFRNSYDKTMSVAFVAGSRVMV